MKANKQLVCTLALTVSVFASQAMASSWQDQLSSATNELSKITAPGSPTTQGTSSSLSSLTSLIGGGTKALTSSTMTNAAGILEYCMKNKLVSATNTDNVQNHLLDKLGLNSSAQQSQKPDYTQGLMGLLNTGNGQQVNLATLGNSSLAEEVKTKACDLVLKQGMHFLS